MIEITKRLISPELVVNKVKTDSSGCVVTYIGLIRGYSQGKRVLSVDYEDAEGTAENELQEIASEIRQKWQINNALTTFRTDRRLSRLGRVDKPSLED